MAVVQLTFDFLCQGYGWSESWYKETDLTSLKAFHTASAVPLMEKRNAMLGQEAALTALTSSFVLERGDSYLAYTGKYQGGLGPDIHCSSPHEAIWTIIRTADAKHYRGVWLRGIPDDLVLNGGIFDAGYAPWVQPATTFMDAIKNGTWGWYSQVRSTLSFAVVGYTQDPVTNLVDVECTGNPFAGVTVGDFKRVRVLFKKQQSKLNGSYTVIVTGTNSFQLLLPTAVFAFTKPGKMWTYSPLFRACDNWSFQKAGERRAGRPKLHTPGHGRATPRG